MYTLSDEMRGNGSAGGGGGGSARHREPSPYQNNDPRARGSSRRNANNTFTPGGNVNYGNANTNGNGARRQANDTFTPGSNRTNTMTTATATAARKKKATATGLITTSANDNPFRLPPLTSAERAYMVRRAKESSIALVDHAHTLDGPVEWQYTGKFRGIQMYRGEGTRSATGASTSDDGMEYLCGVTTMMGTLAEVAAYFDQSTTERMRAKKAADVLDCAVLYALDGAYTGTTGSTGTTSTNPFYRVAVKYTSFEGPSTFSRARDYVYLECQDTFRHASGRRGFVLAMHSIKLPHCPEMDGTVRGSMYHSGYVFVEAERAGYMDVMHSLQINFKATKRLPSFMLNAALKRRITSVITISRAIQVARMGSQTLLRKQDLMPKSSRTVCANCARKFTLFIRKTRCRMCGQVVCQSCAPQIDWEHTGHSGGGGGGTGSMDSSELKKKTRICVQCYRTGGGGGLAPSTTSSTGTSKHSAEFSDDDDDVDGEAEATTDVNAAHDKRQEYGDEEAEVDAVGLEEQTEESVFAQSRFTRTADSLFSFSQSDFHIHDVVGSGAAAAASQGPRAKPIGWHDMIGTSYDQPPDVLTLQEDATFDADLSFAPGNSNFYNTKVYLTPDDTDEELDKRARRYDPNFRSTALSSAFTGAVPPPPPPPPLSPQTLSVEALAQHNQQRRVPAGSTAPTTKKVYGAPALLPQQQTSGKLVSIRDMRSNVLKGSTKGDVPQPPPAAPPAAPPVADEEYYVSRPPSAILNHVRANRSRTIQFTPEGGGDYRSLGAMQQRFADRASANASTATASYGTPQQLRVPEPERNSDDDEPFTLAQLEAPATPPGTPPPRGVQYDERSTASSPRAFVPTPSPRKSPLDMEADDDAYAPVSAFALSHVRAHRSQTIEFMPQFDRQASSTTSDDGLEAAEKEPVGPSTGRCRDDADDTAPPRVTEQYASLELPPPDDDSDDHATRFSQTLIPILDFSASHRRSSDDNDANANHSRLTLELGDATTTTTRASRQLSDVPLLARSNVSEASVRDSELDFELLSRSTTVIMDQVSAYRRQQQRRDSPPVDATDDNTYDRSTEIMKHIERDHQQRMAELNRIALDVTGARISHLHLVDEDRESLIDDDPQQHQVNRVGERENDAERHSNDDTEPFAMRRTLQHSPRRSSGVRPSGVGPRSSMNLAFMADDDDRSSSDSSYRIPEPSPPLLQTQQQSRFTNLEFSLDLLEPPPAASPPLQAASQAAFDDSPRASSVVLDDELLSRSTTVLMDQVRANRFPRALEANDDDSDDSELRSTAIMQDKEAAHRARMAELNRLALEHTGERVSTAFAHRASEDAEAAADWNPDRSLLHQVHTTQLETDWRSTAVLERYETAHDATMAALEQRVRDLDDACRASMASIFSADELDFTELEDAAKAAPVAPVAPTPALSPVRPKYQHRVVPPVPTSSRIVGKHTAGSTTGGSKTNENSARIANLYSVAHLKPVAARRAPVEMHERVSTATLYEQIAQLTQLQSQMALAKDAEDEDAFKQRIKEQYQLLRTLKLRGY